MATKKDLTKLTKADLVALVAGLQTKADKFDDIQATFSDKLEKHAKENSLNVCDDGRKAFAEDLGINYVSPKITGWVSVSFSGVFGKTENSTTYYGSSRQFNVDVFKERLDAFLDTLKEEGLVSADADVVVEDLEEY